MKKNIESLFFEEKKKFLKKNNDELNYGGGLFSEVFNVREHIKMWNDFLVFSI